MQIDDDDDDGGNEYVSFGVYEVFRPSTILSLEWRNIILRNQHRINDLIDRPIPPAERARAHARSRFHLQVQCCCVQHLTQLSNWRMNSWPICMRACAPRMIGDLRARARCTKACVYGAEINELCARACVLIYGGRLRDAVPEMYVGQTASNCAREGPSPMRPCCMLHFLCVCRCFARVLCSPLSCCGPIVLRDFRDWGAS